jgi:hypothetical protein
MRWMAWSYHDLRSCPASVVQQIIDTINREAKNGANVV